jgi:hypothetical protein
MAGGNREEAETVVNNGQQIEIADNNKGAKSDNARAIVEVVTLAQPRSLEPIYEAVVLRPGGPGHPGGPGRDSSCSGVEEEASGGPSPPARQLMRRDSKGGLSPRVNRRQPTVRRYGKI